MFKVLIQRVPAGDIQEHDHVALDLSRPRLISYDIVHWSFSIEVIANQFRSFTANNIGIGMRLLKLTRACGCGWVQALTKFYGKVFRAVVSGQDLGQSYCMLVSILDTHVLVLE